MTKDGLVGRGRWEETLESLLLRKKKKNEVVVRSVSDATASAKGRKELREKSLLEGGRRGGGGNQLRSLRHCQEGEKGSTTPDRHEQNLEGSQEEVFWRGKRGGALTLSTPGTWGKKR